MIARKRRGMRAVWFAFLMAASAMAPGEGAGQESKEPERIVEQVDTDVLRPCPQDKIARLLRTAVTPGQISAALALERETLKFCAQRQALVLRLFELESRIRDKTPELVVVPEPKVIIKEVPVERIVEVPTPVTSKAPAVNVADMGFFSVFGSAAKPKAGITLGDGSRVFVGVGDDVAGIGKVESISINPAEVRVSGALKNPLPLRKGQ